MKLVRYALWLSYGVLWAGGIVSYCFLGKPPADALWTAPCFLYLAAILAMLESPGDRIWLIRAAMIGFAAEIIGLHTGVPFGRYVYTGALGAAAFGVPLAIPCAWLALAAYVRQMAPANGWKLLLPAACMTGIDAALDPLASGGLGYWRWLDRGGWYGVPAINFAGWFLVSALLFALPEPRLRTYDRVRLLGGSVIVFFTIIAFVQGVWGGAIAGVLLLALHVRLRVDPKRTTTSSSIAAA